MIRAIFFDVDGTLVSFDTHVCPTPVLEALHRLREQGIKLFLATGRPPQMLSYIYSQFTFDAQVTLSGQYCFTPERILRQNPMPRSHVEAVVNAARKHGFSCMVLRGEDAFVNHLDDFSRLFCAELDIPIPTQMALENALTQPVYQMIAFLPPEQEHILHQENPELKFTRWNPTFLDIIPPTGGKDVGIQSVMEHYGLSPDEVMAFGDGENDLPMLRYAGIGVAMGTASDFVKSQSDYVTGTVDELGILHALEHYGLV